MRTLAARPSLILALAGAALAIPAGATTVVVPYLDNGYSYQVVAHDAGTGFEQPGFDDSGFSTGTAGFGSLGECPLNNATYVSTDWPLDTDILLRKWFTLPPGATDITVSVPIDNVVQVFVNGQDISGGLQSNFFGCASRDQQLVFSGHGTVGTNLLAMRGQDFGVEDYVDVQVTLGLCSATPRSSCRTASKSLLMIKNAADNGKDKLLWKWILGQATSQAEFGDPTSATDYALCIYAGTPATLLEELAVPAEGTKWTPSGTVGYKYKDTAGTAAGIQKIVLRGSTENKAKLLVKGRGANLPDPALGSIPAPVTAQLVKTDTPVCWEATYDAHVIKNEPDQFKAKAP